MNQSSTHFNASAATWDKPEKIEQAKKFSEVIKTALQKIDPSYKIKSILEVGCGTGILGSNFMQENIPYTGVDSSVEMLNVLRSKFPQQHIKTLNLDVEKEDLSSLDYNFVISQMAFHHLHNPVAVLKKLKQKSPAKIAIIDLDKEDGSFHPDPQGMGVRHFGFSKNEIETWAQESGLKLEHYQIINTIQKNDQEYPQFLAILG